MESYDLYIANDYYDYDYDIWIRDVLIKPTLLDNRNWTLKIFFKKKR